MQGTLPGISREESLKWLKSVEEEFRHGPGAKKALKGEDAMGQEVSASS